MTGEETAVDPAQDPRFKSDGSLVKPRGPLKNAKREAFVRYVVEGWDKTKAYYESGYKPGTKPQAIKDAHRLYKREDVQARIFELQMGSKEFVDDSKEARENPAIDSTYINMQMKLLLDLAKKEKKLTLARDMIQMMGKTIGMFNEENPTHVPDPKTPAIPNNSGGPLNIKNLTQIVNNNDRGSGSDVQDGPTDIEAEYTEDVVSDGDSKSE